MEAMLGALPKVLAASFPCPALGTADPMAVSNGLAEVFGVLAEPKDAKAPDPRPKALDAPPVGDVKPPGVVVKGLALL